MRRRAVGLLAATVALLASLGVLWAAPPTPPRCPKPLDVCLREKTQLYQNRGVFGVMWSEVTPEDRAPAGAHFMVNEVQRGYPAAAAGLQPGDFLLALNGRELAGLTREGVEDLFAVVRAGSTVALRVSRGGQARTLRVVAGRPDQRSVETWVAQHVRERHGPEDSREFLRRKREAQGRHGPTSAPSAPLGPPTGAPAPPAGASSSGASSSAAPSPPSPSATRAAGGGHSSGRHPPDRRLPPLRLGGRAVIAAGLMDRR